MRGMFHGGSVAAALVAAGALVVAVLPTSATATPDHPPAPQSSRLLDGRAHGRHAIAELGDDLATAASRNDMSPRRLKRLLTDDATLWLDEQGRAFYVDPAPTGT